jgi:hypothetical protein
VNYIEIARDIGDVYDFVATPVTWLEWHPSTCGLTGTSCRPLRAGDRVSEEFRAFGLRHRVDWTVIESQAPHRWAAVGRHLGGDATLRYTMCRSAGGTRVEGVFVYQSDGIWRSLIDGLVVRQRLVAESREAVLRLKRLLEGHSSHGDQRVLVDPDRRAGQSRDSFTH